MALTKAAERRRLAERQERAVARYFFHLRDGHDVLIDAEGQEIPHREQIGPHALREARAMISQETLGGRILLNQYIEVRDESGRLVHQLSFRDAVTIIG